MEMLAFRGHPGELHVFVKKLNSLADIYLSSKCIFRGVYFTNKNQSENHCKHFNSVLLTPTKFVLFSNQKVRKYVHL